MVNNAQSAELAYTCISCLINSNIIKNVGIGLMSTQIPCLYHYGNTFYLHMYLRCYADSGGGRREAT